MQSTVQTPKAKKEKHLTHASWQLRDLLIKIKMCYLNCIVTQKTMPIYSSRITLLQIELNQRIDTMWSDTERRTMSAQMQQYDHALEIVSALQKSADESVNHFSKIFANTAMDEKMGDICLSTNKVMFLKQQIDILRAILLHNQFYTHDDPKCYVQTLIFSACVHKKISP